MPLLQSPEAKKKKRKLSKKTVYFCTKCCSGEGESAKKSIRVCFLCFLSEGQNCDGIHCRCIDDWEDVEGDNWSCRLCNSDGAPWYANSLQAATNWLNHANCLVNRASRTKANKGGSSESNSSVTHRICGGELGCGGAEFSLMQPRGQSVFFVMCQKPEDRFHKAECLQVKTYVQFIGQSTVHKTVQEQGDLAIQRLKETLKSPQYATQIERKNTAVQEAKKKKEPSFSDAAEMECWLIQECRNLLLSLTEQGNLMNPDKKFTETATAFILRMEQDATDLFEEYLKADWSRDSRYYRRNVRLNPRITASLTRPSANKSTSPCSGDVDLLAEGLAKLGFENELTAAAEIGKMDQVRTCLDSWGVSRKVDLINTPNADSCSALYVAARAGHVEIVRLLLTEKADPLVGNTAFMETALMIAAKQGWMECVKVLLELTEQTLPAVFVNHVDIDGNTALMKASRHHRPEVVQLLLEKRADPMKKTMKGGTSAMKYAAMGGSKECVDILKQQLLDKLGSTPSDRDWDMMWKDKDEMTPLHFAAMGGHYDCVTALTKMVFEVCKLLHQENGYKQVVTLLLSKDKDGRTPLDLAMKGGHGGCFHYLRFVDIWAVGTFPKVPSQTYEMPDEMPTAIGQCSASGRT